MKDVEKLLDSITKKCEECNETMPVRAVMVIYRETINIFMSKSQCFKRLKDNPYTSDDFFGVISGLMLSFLSTIYANATAKSEEEMLEIIKEISPDFVVGMKRKTDA